MGDSALLQFHGFGYAIVAFCGNRQFFSFRLVPCNRNGDDFRIGVLFCAVGYYSVFNHFSGSPVKNYDSCFVSAQMVAGGINGFVYGLNFEAVFGCPFFGVGVGGADDGYVEGTIDNSLTIIQRFISPFPMCTVKRSYSNVRNV